ncbi:hypothetical protein [Dongia sp.]|uniref:hypothetical protein n=1 Tax=Dongia sp. TaxID=1977262 RepID=UPI0035AF5BC2
MKKTDFGRVLCFVLGMTMGIFLTGALAHEVIGSGHTDAEMDWNGDGETSLGEMLYGIDVGVRSVEVNGCPCRFFFEYKDGRSIKTMCDGKIVDFDPYAPAVGQ